MNGRAVTNRRWKRFGFGLAASLCLSANLLPTEFAVASPGAKVDLVVANRSSPVVTPGVEVTQTTTVTNRGESTTGPVSVKYTLPMLINIDLSRPLGDNCKVIYHNVDKGVPSIVECVLPGLRTGERRTISWPIELAEANPPTVGSYGVMSVTPASGSTDVDQDITDNISPAGVLLQKGTAPPSSSGRPVDLYLAGDIPAIQGGGHGWTMLQVGNTAARATSGPVRVVYVTPPFVNFDRGQSLPAGCRFLLQDPRPTVPEIAECVRLDPLASGKVWTVRLPLSVVRGGPKGEYYGASIVTPGSLEQPSGDYDVDLVDNLHGPGVNVIGS